MSIKQISVFLENKPGRLQKMTAVLAANNIDMRALSLAETKDFGIARIIVDDVLNAVSVLKDADFIANLTSVLAVEIPNKPGGLDEMLKIFAETNVNIEYMYAFFMPKDLTSVYMVFRTSDTKASEAKLVGKGIKTLSQEDLAEL